ncbi:MAG: GNAT family N-acetyltransferase [Deltaproteobacteria bacterium]|nr:GNAT family N-acetyltransferase [Deltaproteobacteria bacterium]
MTQGISVERLTTIEGFSAMRGEWNGLLAASPANTVFLRWEWLFEWWKAYVNPGLSLSIMLVKKSGALIGIGPFYLTNARMMFLGTKHGCVISEYMDIIYREDDCDEVISAIIAYTVESGLSEMLLENIPSDSTSLRALEKYAQTNKLSYLTAAEKTSPYIKLQTPYSFEEFLEERGASIRRKIKTEQRKLSRLSGVVVRRTSGAHELDRDYAELVRLHGERWSGKGTSGAFSDPLFSAFHRGVCGWMLDCGFLELGFISVSGRNIAAIYNLNYNGKVYFYQSGMDKDFNRSMSPGLLLHSLSIRDAIDAGATEYDFMIAGPGDAYKKTWTDDYHCLCDVYIATPCIMRIYMLTKGAKARIKRLIERLGGARH